MWDAVSTHTINFICVRRFLYLPAWFPVYVWGFFIYYLPSWLPIDDRAVFLFTHMITFICMGRFLCLPVWFPMYVWGSFFNYPPGYLDMCQAVSLFICMVSWIYMNYLWNIPVTCRCVRRFPISFMVSMLLPRLPKQVVYRKNKFTSRISYVVI